MVLVNSPNYQYVNGSMGEYLGKTMVHNRDGIKVEHVMVALFDKDETVMIPKHEWKIDLSVLSEVFDVDAKLIKKSENKPRNTKHPWKRGRRRKKKR